MLDGVDSIRHFIQAFIKANDNAGDNSDEDEDEDDTHKVPEQKLLEFKKMDIKLLEFKKEVESVKSEISKISNITVEDSDTKGVKDIKNKISKAIDTLKDVTTVMSDRDSEFNRKLNIIKDRKSKGFETPSEVNIIIVKGREKLVGAIKVSSEVYSKVKGALANILKKRETDVLDDIFKSYSKKKEKLVGAIKVSSEVYSKVKGVLS